MIVIIFAAGKWLYNKLQNAIDVTAQATQSLNLLYRKFINKAEGTYYTAEFLRSQWELERSAQGSKEHVM